nr:helix-turn-helix transcriptional regulator [Peptacetobacter sp.]
MGVSVPAISKWENATNYPDIMLLPAIARLLGTDLNTLLSFKDNLTKNEVALFMNEVAEIIEKDGFEVGYQLAMDKIKEYPNCDLLISNIAMLLDGALILTGEKTIDKYQEEIEQLHRRAANSSDINIREQSQGILISKLIENGKFDEAQDIINTLTDKSWTDKKRLQAELNIAKGEFYEAAQITEEKLLSATSEIHSCLMCLMEIALKENRLSDAEYIANVDKNAAQIFDLWEYNSYVAHSQLYDATKERIKAIKILIPMLKSLTKKWEINKSPLYRHIKTKEVDKTFGRKLQKSIIQSLNNDEKESLKKNIEFKQIIQQLNDDL